jgi:2-keto-3-deoxy-L-rhamnonate aldolase RhmA
MPRRSFQSLLAKGSSLGTWSQIASAEVIDMLGAAGLDFTIVDCEHGAFGIETAENLYRWSARHRLNRDSSGERWMPARPQC